MTTRRRTTLAITATGALLLSACQGGGAGAGNDGAAAAAATEAADAGQVKDATDVVASLDGYRSRIAGVFLDDRTEIVDLDTARRIVNQRGLNVETLLRSMPNVPLGAGSDEELARYAELHAALSAWAAASRDTLTTFDERRPELEALVDEWGGEGAPPEEYLDVLEADFDAATAFGDACAAFLDETGLTADCYAFLPEGADALVTTHQVTVGDVVLAFDESGVGFVETLDGAVVSGGELTTLYLGQPPMVVDPASEPDGDGSPEVEQAIPWPSDPAIWYGALPVEVLDEGELSVGESGRMWSYAVVVGRSDEPFALLRAGDLSIFPVNVDFEVVLWWTTIDGQPVVAASDGRPDLGYQEHFGIIADVLETLRVAD